MISIMNKLSAGEFRFYCWPDFEYISFGQEPARNRQR